MKSKNLISSTKPEEKKHLKSPATSENEAESDSSNKLQWSKNNRKESNLNEMLKNKRERSSSSQEGFKDSTYSSKASKGETRIKSTQSNDDIDDEEVGSSKVERTKFESARTNKNQSKYERFKDKKDGKNDIININFIVNNNTTIDSSNNNELLENQIDENNFSKSMKNNNIIKGNKILVEEGTAFGHKNKKNILNQISRYAILSDSVKENNKGAKHFANNNNSHNSNHNNSYSDSEDNTKKVIKKNKTSIGNNNKNGSITDDLTDKKNRKNNQAKEDTITDAEEKLNNNINVLENILNKYKNQDNVTVNTNIVCTNTNNINNSSNFEKRMKKVEKIDPSPMPIPAKKQSSGIPNFVYPIDDFILYQNPEEHRLEPEFLKKPPPKEFYVSPKEFGPIMNCWSFLMAFRDTLALSFFTPEALYYSLVRIIY